MNNTITSLMQVNVFTVGPDATAQSIEALMAAQGLSWVPVVDKDVVLGVISSADLLRLHADGRSSTQVSAWQLCTYKPISVPPDATLAEVARLMVESGIHHVIVVDGDHIRGVVSSLDFVRTFMD